MPIFIGANWKITESDNKIQVREFLKNILKEQDITSLVEIDTPSVFISAALKTYESKEEKILLLPNQSGIVLGRVYTSQEDTDTGSLIARDYCKISQSNGKFLSDHYWGRFIIIILNEYNHFEIYRDSTGLAQVYFLDCNDFVLFSSDIYLIFKVSKFYGKYLNKNWKYFSSYFRYPSLLESILKSACKKLIICHILSLRGAKRRGNPCIFKYFSTI